MSGVALGADIAMVAPLRSCVLELGAGKHAVHDRLPMTAEILTSALRAAAMNGGRRPALVALELAASSARNAMTSFWK